MLRTIEVATRDGDLLRGAPGELVPVCASDGRFALMLEVDQGPQRPCGALIEEITTVAAIDQGASVADVAATIEAVCSDRLSVAGGRTFEIVVSDHEYVEVTIRRGQVCCQPGYPDTTSD